MIEDRDLALQPCHAFSKRNRKLHVCYIYFVKLMNANAAMTVDKSTLCRG